MVEPDSERALPAEEMKETILDLGFLAEENIEVMGKDYEQALERAVELTESSMLDAVICVFGSFYYIGDVRQLILNNKKER